MWLCVVICCYVIAYLCILTSTLRKQLVDPFPFIMVRLSKEPKSFNIWRQHSRIRCRVRQVGVSEARLHFPVAVFMAETPGKAFQSTPRPATSQAEVARSKRMQIGG